MGVVFHLQQPGWQGLPAVLIWLAGQVGGDFLDLLEVPGHVLGFFAGGAGFETEERE
jgi:hypothetical protein